MTVTVGIIDDDEDSNLILAALLEDKYQVLAFQNWREALQAFEHNIPDLILLDISMPDTDGYTVLKHIREKPALKHVPIIALTAYALADTNSDFIQKGFAGVVAKPIFDSTTLFHLFNRLLKD